MCGIAGIHESDPRALVPPELLERMADVMVHRGPDDEGFHLGDGVGLAHRRLSIVDLAGGRQPMRNEDGSVVVVFNGEIYNHADLRRRLVARGHRFATRSDTEVIVHAYEEDGVDCVESFRGMFAFALWDARRRRLLLVRDRLGIKPLYYHETPRRLVFASEIKALLEHPEVPREIDSEALETYLRLRYVPGSRTLLRGIRRLPPGHLLVREAGDRSLRRWWSLPQEEPGSEPSLAQAAEELRALLDEATELRLRADVPVGLFLSGGLDSTTMLEAATRLRPGQPAKTFSIGYAASSAEERASDELEFARTAATAFGSEHHELVLGARELRDALPEVVWHLDEPVADPACIPLLLLARRAREEVTVILSGEGADEILAGYAIHRRMLALETVHRRLPDAVAGLAGRIAGRLPEGRLSELLGQAAQPLGSRYRGVSRAFRPRLLARLLGRDPGGETSTGPGAVPNGHRSTLGHLMEVDLATWLPDDLLVKADKMTMAASVELRVPFLDHRLVEWAARLPPDLKVGGGVGKRVLREAMRGRIPDAILDRPKKGFPVPTVPLLRRLGPWVRERLTGSGSACRDLFDGAVVERLLAEHESGRRGREPEIFSLLVLELWHARFLRTPPAPPVRRRPSEPPIRAAAG